MELRSREGAGRVQSLLPARVLLVEGVVDLLDLLALVADLVGAGNAADDREDDHAEDEQSDDEVVLAAVADDVVAESDDDDQRDPTQGEGILDLIDLTLEFVDPRMLAFGVRHDEAPLLEVAVEIAISKNYNAKIQYIYKKVNLPYTGESEKDPSRNTVSGNV